MKKFLVLILVILLIGILSANTVEQQVYGILVPEGVLPDQKVAVGECLDADFEYYSGETPHSFETYFENVYCEFISEVPENLTIYGNENDCVVEWCSPNENQTGNYFIEINASSGEYFSNYSFNLGVYDYKISFKEGWNLISIPLVPDNISIEFVFGDIINEIAYISSNIATILQYDAVKNKWYKSRPSEEHNDFYWASNSELTKIIPGYGYWLYMDEATELYLNGEKFYNANSSASPPEIILATNSWNLIGVYGLDNPEIYKALISLTDIYGSPYYDIIYDSELNDEITNLISKEGYWLSIKPFNSSDTIGYRANY